MNLAGTASPETIRPSTPAPAKQLSQQDRAVWSVVHLLLRGRVVAGTGTVDRPGVGRKARAWAEARRAAARESARFAERQTSHWE